MVQKEFIFPDGTRIIYEDKSGKIQRFIKYPYTHQELEKIKENPILKYIYDKKVRTYNAGKYYYLENLYDISHKLDDNQKHQLYEDLKTLHDKVGRVDDPNCFIKTFGKYYPENRIQCAAIFSLIYLAMLDLEENKRAYPNSLGKTMVLKSCQAVILNGANYEEAAKMYEKRNNLNDLQDDESTESNSSYEKYNGYNGYDDDTIDIAFDGHPEATWNVD